MNGPVALLFYTFVLGCTVCEGSMAASFNCQRASTAIEKAICANPEINDADEQLAILFRKAKSSKDSNEIAKEQQAWIKARNKCQDKACVLSMYRDRITTLSAMFGPPQPADAPPLLNLPALKSEQSPDIAFRHTSASVAGIIEFGHDEAGGNFTFVDQLGGRVVLSYLWNLSGDEQHALSALEGTPVQIVGDLTVYAEDGSSAFSRGRPITIYRINDLRTPTEPVRDSARNTSPERVAQDRTHRDQYRQMGSVAAIAETCYGSTAIAEKLSVLINKVSQQDPSVAPAINLLIDEYNEAYFFAATEMKIWNGGSQSYNSAPFSCEISDDVDMVKKLEETILNNLK